MSKRDLLLKIFLPLLILGAAVLVTWLMIQSRKMPEPHEAAFVGPLVEVMTVSRESRDVVVSGTGTVQPRRQVAVTPQVSGELVELSPQMVTGGFVAQGALLFVIEDTDYRLALERARANLAQAELELAKISGQAEVARLEWRRLNDAEQAEPKPLVVYEPQLNSAEAQRAAAAAAVAQAQLDLERTHVRAPFNAYVRSENVEVGQYVRDGNSVAVLAGTDEAEIVVPLPLEELNWIPLPAAETREQGAQVEIQLQLGSRVQTWQGRVDRLLGDVDPQNRMAELVISVVDPFGLESGAAAAAQPLAPGTFVKVMIAGKSLPDVAVVPRSALHGDATVWIIDAEQKLRIRPVEILRRERADVLVADGLQDGDRVVLTNISGGADGMLLRPRPAEDQP